MPALGLEYYKMPAAAKCTSLRSAIFSGEAMPIELVDLIYRNVPKGVTVYNAYGRLAGEAGQLGDRGGFALKFEGLLCSHGCPPPFSKQECNELSVTSHCIYESLTYV